MRKILTRVAVCGALALSLVGDNIAFADGVQQSAPSATDSDSAGVAAGQPVAATKDTSDAAATKESARPAAAGDPVAAMDDPLFQRARADGLSLVTPYPGEASLAAKSSGLNIDLGTPFKAAAEPAPGLTAVHRMWRASSSDFINVLAGSNAYSNAVASGYKDQGVRFYALGSPVEGRTEPVTNYMKNGKSRLATGSGAAALQAEGWKSAGVAFYMPSAAAPKPPNPPKPQPPAPNPGNSGVGSLPVGQANYGIPGNAVFVATWGNDNAAGTSADQPLRTVAAAVNKAPSGATIVIRGGEYETETLTFTKPVSLQNYPNEAVWLDGSVELSNWGWDSGAWRKDGWTRRFDASPTYVKGAPDSDKKYWQFINPNFPMASHPEQLFIDGTPMKQVQRRDQVKEGTFYVDEGSSRLYLGSNPNGKSVRVSKEVKAMNVRVAGFKMRGIGIRRYSPSVPDLGAVVLEKPSAQLENVVIEDSSTTGLSLLESDIKLNKVTVKGSGMLGIHGRFADRVTMTSVLSTKNNAEHFNIAPVSGGAKLGHTRQIRIIGSSFSGNYGHGFWEDMSCSDTVARQTKFSDNEGNGLFLEISSSAIVGDNVFANNKEFGIKVNNINNVEIWNNTFVGNERPLNIVQDNRRNNNKWDQAVDPRLNWPDPGMPWTLGPVTMRNNVVSRNSGGNCLLCVEDYSQQKTAEQMGISADSNVYMRASAGAPTWTVIWSRGWNNPAIFTTLKAFTNATGQERNGQEYVGEEIIDSNFRLTGRAAGTVQSKATPLPGDIASAIGRPAGSKMLGTY